MKFIINKIEFKNKSHVQAHAKEILYAGPTNTRLSSDEFDFMHDYFKNLHKEFKQKEGSGISHILRVKEPNYGNHNGFRICRLDGSSTDISYMLSSIMNKNYMSDFKSACRTVIEPFVHEFKKKFFEENQSPVCPLTSEPMSYAKSHTDHFKPTFDEIVKEFIYLEDIGEQSLPSMVKESTDNQTFYQLSDLDMASRFYAFHASKASLRILSPRGNLSIAKRK